ncbi:uncharacterized protein BJ171DRAFT_594636, partial [Polychytrium aggregatum]|uniref:uncharacterized protein n=1 Tax=Polychytrium aggregatum TaxID=110093 RepID=UPI0022FEB32D
LTPPPASAPASARASLHRLWIGLPLPSSSICSVPAASSVFTGCRDAEPNARQVHGRCCRRPHDRRCRVHGTEAGAEDPPLRNARALHPQKEAYPAHYGQRPLVRSTLNTRTPPSL